MSSSEIPETSEPDSPSEPQDPNKPFLQGVVHSILEEEPAAGRQLNSHIRRRINQLPEEERAHGKHSLASSHSALKSTAKAFKNLDRRPVDNQGRKARNITELDTLWGGRAWIPPFKRFRDLEAVNFDNISMGDINYLLSTSKLARSRGVALDSLYQPGGLIHGLTVLLNGVRTSKDALAQAKTLWSQAPQIAIAGPAPGDPPSDEEIPEGGRLIAGQSMDIDISSDIFESHGDDGGFGPLLDMPEDDDNEVTERLYSEDLGTERLGKRKSGDSDAFPQIDITGVSSVYDDPEKARRQLQNREWLSDDTIDMLSRRIKRLAATSTNDDEVPVMNPMYIKLDQPTLARPPARLTTGVVIIPLHHKDHWTVTRVDIDKRQVQWYDPLSRGSHRAEAERLISWFEPNGEPFSFEQVTGPTQPDSTSCGVYVLMAIHSWLQGTPFPDIFEQPNEFMISLLDQDSTAEVGESSRPQPGRSCSRSPSPKRQQEDQPHATNILPTTYEGMHACMQDIKTKLRNDCTSEPRQSKASLVASLVDLESELAGLEEELKSLSVWIEAVRRYNSASQYLGPFQRDAPGPDMEDINNTSPLRLLREDAVHFRDERLAQFCTTGEDEADIDELVARLEELPGLIAAAEDANSGTKKKIVREEWLVKLRAEMVECIKAVDGEE
ncbi:hypothetical protein ACHAPU_009142 [Fusarium lateritium]